MKIECSAATPWGIHSTLVDHQCPRCGWAVDHPAPSVQPQNFFAAAARRLRALRMPMRRAA